MTIVKQEKIDSSYMSSSYGIDPYCLEDCASSHFVTKQARDIMDINERNRRRAENSNMIDMEDMNTGTLNNRTIVDDGRNYDFGTPQLRGMTPEQSNIDYGTAGENMRTSRNDDRSDNMYTLNGGGQFENRQNIYERHSNSDMQYVGNEESERSYKDRRNNTETIRELRNNQTRFDEVEQIYVEDLSNMTQEKLKYLNNFLRTQIGKEVQVEFLLGLNTMVEKVGILVGVGENYILLGDVEGNGMTACDFDDIKFIRFN